MSNKLQTITTKLWAMANELRGRMGLSEHQEQYLIGNRPVPD